MKNLTRRRLACGSEEFDPPFPFPPRASRGGRVPPTGQTAPLPPQEGFQIAPLKSPLRIPLRRL
jgi:hypothetical protein